MNILVYGFGTMASAMVDGWLRAGMAPADLTAFNPRLKAVPEGVTLITDAPAQAPDILVLGFKPGMLARIAPDIGPLAGPSTTVVSILAGIDLATLQRQFPAAQAVVRFMPNLAVALGKSPNILAARGLDADSRVVVTRLADMLGTAEWLDDERLFDAATALAGCGPAYVYRFIDALAAGGGELGLPADLAQRLAVQMAEGAAALAAASPHSPGALADRVASPGGMTRQGLDVFDADDALARLAGEALRATRDRGAEMGRSAHETV